MEDSIVFRIGARWVLVKRQPGELEEAWHRRAHHVRKALLAAADDIHTEDLQAFINKSKDEWDSWLATITTVAGVPT